MTFDELRKGKAVTFYPNELIEKTKGLRKDWKLIVYEVFAENISSGNPVPVYMLPIIFNEIPEYQKQIELLLKAKILSEDEDGGLFLPLSTK